MYANRRAARFRLAEITPAVLEFQDSSVTPCELQIISRTGGVLLLSKVLDQGSAGTVVFPTHKRLVFATAEMLPPLSGTHQPFHLVELKQDDERKLLAAFQSLLYRYV